MDIITVDNIPDKWCVARQVGETNAVVWFPSWFIEQGFFQAPGPKYIVNWIDAPVTVRQEWPDGRVRIWKLTGQRNCRGEWLGVWPD